MGQGTVSNVQVVFSRVEVDRIRISSFVNGTWHSIDRRNDKVAQHFSPTLVILFSFFCILFFVYIYFDGPCFSLNVYTHPKQKPKNKVPEPTFSPDRLCSNGVFLSIRYQVLPATRPTTGTENDAGTCGCTIRDTGCLHVVHWFRPYQLRNYVSSSKSTRKENAAIESKNRTFIRLVAACFVLYDVGWYYGGFIIWTETNKTNS